MGTLFFQKSVGTVAHDPARTTHMRIEEKREERGEFGLTHDEEDVTW
jgi:hypothetical protein